MVIRRDDGSFEFYCEVCGAHFVMQNDEKLTKTYIDRGDGSHTCSVSYIPEAPTLAFSVSGSKENPESPPESQTRGGCASGACRL